MQAIALIYDMILLMFYVVAITISLTVLQLKKHANCRYVAALFGVFALDHVIITLTEMIPWFSKAYDQVFLTVPSTKTLIYALSFTFMIILLKASMPYFNPIPLACLATLTIIIMLFVPMLPNSAFKFWLYFLPAQIFHFIYAASGLNTIKKKPAEYFTWEIPHIKRIFKILIVFSIIILLEDTFVIFRLDHYEYIVNIMNRSISEDIMRLILAGYSIRTTALLLCEKKEETTDNNVEQREVSNTSEDFDKEMDLIVDSDTERTLCAFCQDYHLTGRETEIFALILENMTNQEISDELLVSLGTVKTHTHNIFAKLDVTRRREAIQLYANYINE